MLLSADHPHCAGSPSAAAAASTSTDAASAAASTGQPEHNGERVLQTMRWGLIPVWHKGDPNKFGTVLNNSRIEGLTEKPSFRNALKKGQRCVIVCEG